MSKEIRANQKHLTLDNRIFIEKSLDNGMSFKDISKHLSKDPTTISKEVKKHRQLKQHNTFVSFNNCVFRTTCTKRNICQRSVSCNKYCKSCNYCNTRCSSFVPYKCLLLDHAPFVCNPCSKKSNCRVDKYYYKAITANRRYKSLLVSSREGINITESQLQLLDETITPLVLQGQSIYQIVSNHEEIPCSIRTIYSYIERQILSVKNLDLARKVKYKPRRVKRQELKEPSWAQGRTYDDFLLFIAANPDLNVVEMDTVVGCQGSNKVLLTLYFRLSKCMLIFLLPDKKQASVLSVFEDLEKLLGTDIFAKVFSVILTDRGTEFGNPNALEIGKGPICRTNIFFCDPLASFQKACIEKNHEYIRYVLPKGSTFDNLSQTDITLLANHINSTPRASLNGCTPFELARMLLGKIVIGAFNLEAVASDDVTLKPSLLKK
jgi:IS30 family transposase